MALLSRLHWWTVEYGLIGTLDNPKIYGAGLLSSIGESVSCLESNVKKIPYSIDAQTMRVRYHDETAATLCLPRLPAPLDVLEEFASKMAFRVGGLEGINKAIECKNVATCEYSSGLQVSGVFTEVITDDKQFAVYLRTTGQRAGFQTRNSQVMARLSQGRLRFADRGLEADVSVPETLTDDQLHALGIAKARKRRWNSTAAWSSRAKSKASCAATANCC